MECEEQNIDAPFLMLKMKLLPYMVRTFLCRNPLNILKQQGPNAYINACTNIMNKWGISSEGKARWLPFLEGWANYAIGRMDKVPENGLPPLTSFAYLRHLENFRELFEKGQNKVVKTNAFHGMVCVISPTEQTARFGAEEVGKALECRNVIPVTDAATRYFTNGVICFGTINQQKKSREFLTGSAENLTVVMYGCSPEDIETELQGQPVNQIKACIGLTRSWDKQRCHMKLVLAKKSISETSEDFKQAIAKIKISTEAVPAADRNVDTKPGVLIFFPGIPGCGKSSVVSSVEEVLQKRLAEFYCGDEVRKIHVLVGDELRKAYWDEVNKTRENDKTCIVIGDKNILQILGQLLEGYVVLPAHFPLPSFQTIHH